MDHLTEDARALLRAAREIHAERHGIETFMLQRYSRCLILDRIAAMGKPTHSVSDRDGIKGSTNRFEERLTRTSRRFLEKPLDL